MQETFLHYLWKFKKFDILNIKTTQNQSIEIVSVGEHNMNAGPDFFNAQVRLDDQLWAGNVEIHVRSSDWFLHHHETDEAYDNVILHVVWNDDSEVLRNDRSLIPTLELSQYVSKSAISNYQKLFSNKKLWINCENDITFIDDFVFNKWLERLYFERLERKLIELEEFLKASKNDWEAILFKLLAKQFGSKVNGDAFVSIANSIDFSIIRKSIAHPDQLEALLFGQAGLLEDNHSDTYFIHLKTEYQFLKRKYGLNNEGVIPLKFFRIRPSNFPTIRLSQLTQLYSSNQNLFSKVIESATVEDLYKLIYNATSPYWETHYTFDQVSRFSIKRITANFTDLLLINVIIPIKFCFAKHQGNSINEEIISLVNSIKSEKNKSVDRFYKLRPFTKSAMNSQAILQLKANYCDKNNCLQCVIGNELLSKN